MKGGAVVAVEIVTVLRRRCFPFDGLGLGAPLECKAGSSRDAVDDKGCRPAPMTIKLCRNYGEMA